MLIDGIPLHPMVVHFPIVIAVFIPLLCLYLLVTAKSHGGSLWKWVAYLQLLLVGSGILVMESGEQEEDRVEQVAGEANIHEHEERAETFVWAAGFVAAFAAAGAWSRKEKYFQIARKLTFVGSIAVAALAGLTGHSGGELVYKHNAGSAYGKNHSTNQVTSPTRINRGHDEQDEDNDEDHDEDSEHESGE